MGDGSSSSLVDFSAVDPSMAGAAGRGSLVTTSPDLALALSGLMQGKLFEQQSTREAWLRFIPAPSEGGAPRAYGLGIERYTSENGLSLIGHAGSTAGYSATVDYVPELRITIAAVVNVDSAAALFGSVVLPRISAFELSQGSR
jgi:CubicO group peptidase (beta-lactamase class C family)